MTGTTRTRQQKFNAAVLDVLKTMAKALTYDGGVRHQGAYAALAQIERIRRTTTRKRKAAVKR